MSYAGHLLSIPRTSEHSMENHPTEEADQLARSTKKMKRASAVGVEQLNDADFSVEDIAMDPTEVLESDPARVLAANLDSNQGQNTPLGDPTGTWCSKITRV